MIAFDCRCGKSLKVKEEHAGKRVRCPSCSQPVQIPELSSEESFLDDFDDEWDEQPAEELPPRKSKSKKKKSSRNQRNSSAHTGFAGAWRRIFGVLAILAGLMASTGIAIAVANGKPRALKGIPVAFVFFGVGINWVRGQTHQ